MRPRVLVLFGVGAFGLFVGTPHAGWDYECRHPMRSGVPCRSVVYCAYYGVEGRRIVVGLRKGHHEGLISFETFEIIQKRLTSTAKAPARKDISADSSCAMTVSSR